MKPWQREEMEEIEYEPTSVRSLLTEMKDVAELIVDLAYSALIFDDEEIAEEVRYLEAYMDTLNYQIRLACMLAGRTIDDAEKLTGTLQVASAAEHMSNAAGDIVDLMENEETRPFLPRILAQGIEKIKLFRVPTGSHLDAETLGDLEVESETGMRVIAVRRGERWSFGPSGSTIMRTGDTLLLRGTDDGFDHFLRLSAAGPEALEDRLDEVSPTRDAEHEEPAPGPEQSNLEEAEWNVLELKNTSELMVDLALSSVIYYNEELAEEVRLLEDHADELHTRVQRSAFDGALREELTAQQAMALLRIAQAAEVIADAGREIADVVLRDVEPHAVLAASIEDSDVVIARVTIEPGAPLAGQRIGEARVKSETGMHIFAIRREGAWIPGPEAPDVVESGDVLLASGPEEGREKLAELCRADQATRRT